ncbi:metal ABC transporter permease [Lujinxingia litoralis]|nr:metal ABC transporter permease [Lujinxingia litoralis]
MAGGSESVFWQRALEFFAMQYDFALYALVAAVLVGAICGLVGTFMVLRGMSLVGDAAGHATLPGVGVAFLLTGTKSAPALLLGAMASAVLGAMTITWLSRGPKVRPEAAIGIVLSTFFGLGIVLLSYIQTSPTGQQSGLSDYLFGNAAAVTPAQIWVVGGAGLLLSMLVVVFYRPLSLMVFDERFARSIGLPTQWLELGLMSALAVAVVLSIQAVGVILVAAMLIIPPSAARLISGRLVGVMVGAMVIGALSGALGAMLSYIYEGVSTGPAMVLVAVTIFGFALVFGPVGGALPSAIRRVRARSLAAGGAL